MRIVPSVALTLSVLCLSLTTQAVAQQFVSSQKVVSATAGYIYGVADFNGDGRLDFLTPGVTSAGNPVATIMLQNANGTFTPVRVANVPSTQSVVADLNGDGKADIASVTPAPTDANGIPLGSATLTISLGNGNATFNVKSPVNLAGDSGPAYVLVVDLNHDGKPDIVTISSDQYGDSFLQSFLNAGGGSFTAGPTYGGSILGGIPYGAADFNGDGIPDLVVKNNFELQILIGKGDGSFTAGATYNMNPLAVGIGDFNKDNHQDLVVVTAQSGTILLGQGNGTFTAGATLNTQFKFNVTSTQYSTNAPMPIGVYVGDLNKDGKLDIALTSESNTVTVAVYLGNGNGTFSNPKAFNVAGGFVDAVPSAFADFNKDGKIDVLALSLEAGFVIAQGDGSGGFKAPILSQTPNPGSIVTADFNGDGIDDVAVVNEPLCSTCTTTSVSVFLGTGKNYFAAPVTYIIPVNRAMIAAGDINNDGRIDLVVARNPNLINQYNSTANSNDDVAVLLGRGDGTFEAPVGYHLLGAPKANTFSSQMYLVDVNKDGKLDLIGDWGVALGKGNGQFGAPLALPSTISGIAALAPGDFNNSGNIGLAVATNTYNGSLFTQPSYVYVLAGYSNGTFHVVNQKSIPDYVSALITADLNGDHRTDILYTTGGYPGATTQLTLTAELSVTGNYGFSSTNYTLAQAPFVNSTYLTGTAILTGDFNRDGKMDVAISTIFQDAGDLALLDGTGGGALSTSPQYYQGSMLQGVVLDVNGDGAPDIVGTTTIGVARLLNTGAK